MRFEEKREKEGIIFTAELSIQKFANTGLKSILCNLVDAVMSFDANVSIDTGYAAIAFVSS